MSFKIEVTANQTGERLTHAFRFASREEASEYASSLFGQWKDCAFSVVTCADPVNYPPAEEDDDQ